MTRDEILRLAREMGVLDENHYGSVWADRLADFAAAVESAARARQDALARLAEADAEIERAPSAEAMRMLDQYAATNAAQAQRVMELCARLEHADGAMLIAAATLVRMREHAIVRHDLSDDAERAISALRSALRGD